MTLADESRLAEFTDLILKLTPTNRKYTLIFLQSIFSAQEDDDSQTKIDE